MSTTKKAKSHTRLFPKNTICSNGLRFKSPVCASPLHLPHPHPIPFYPTPFTLPDYLTNTHTGQAPYTGQATWFARFHPEKLPSAITRYVDEILRVIKVLDLGLSRNATGWLVGDKCTYADLAFRTWAEVGEGLLRELGRDGEMEGFKWYREWLERIDELESVKKVQERMREGRREHGLS
jgi:glutathione S-transferase